jgi:hypothetical protein
MSSLPQSFDPIRSYDKPDVFLTQLSDGEASFESLRRTILSPDDLSLEERDSYVNDIKDALGNNMLTNTMVDIATNPFVLLSFLVTPPAGKALRSTGRLFSTQNWNRYLENEGLSFRILHAMRLAPTTSQLHGTPAGPIMQEMATVLEDLQRLELKTVSPAMENVIDRIERATGYRVKTLDPDLEKNPQIKQILHEINDAMSIKMQKWDVPDRVVTRADLTPFGEKDVRLKFARIEDMSPDGSRIGQFAEPTTLGRKEIRRLAEINNKRDRAIDRIYAKFGSEDPDDLRRILEAEVTDPKYLTRIQDKNRWDVRDRIVEDAEIARDPDQRLHYHSLTQGKFLTTSTKGHARELMEGRTPELVEESDILPNLFTSPQQRAKLDQIINDYGLDEYIDAMKEFRKDRLIKLFGKEGLDNFVVDPNKVTRIGHAVAKAESAGEAVGLFKMIDDVVGNFFDDDVMSFMRTSRSADPEADVSIKARELWNKMQGKLAQFTERGLSDREAYVPRNIIKTIDRSGQEIPVEELGFERKQGDYFLGRSAQTRKRFVGFWDPDDLRRMRDTFGSTDDLDTMINDHESQIAALLDRPEKRASTYRINFQEQFRRYSHRSALTYTMHVARPRRGVFAALEDTLTPEVIEAKRNQTRQSGKLAGWANMRQGLDKEPATLADLYDKVTPSGLPGVAADVDLVTKLEPLGGVSLLDLLEGSVESLADARTRRLITENVLPTITGRRHVSDVVNEAVTKFMEKSIDGLANSALGRAIEKTGDPGKKFIGQMKEWVDDPTRKALRKNANYTGGLSRGLYASHLGLNLGSIQLNMLQPLTMGMPLVGVGPTVKGYVDAFKQMVNYASDRASMPARMTDAQRAELMRKHFTERMTVGGVERDVDFSELADIGKSAFHMVDEANLRSGYRQKEGGLKYWLFEGTMKPFEKAEWFNRLTMAHASKHARISAGKLNSLEDLGRMKDDTISLVQRTQFGSDPINRPEIFYSAYMNNPLARQFLQFPIRQITGTLLNPGEMGGSAFQHVIKAMGYSAIAYEIGKNAPFIGGLDLSRGLFAGSIVDTFGGDRFFRERDPTGALVSNFVPPALDVVINAAQAIGTQDFELLGETIPRVIPGGVAVSRALGVAGQVPAAIGFQREFANWSKMENGQVPVYKADGRFVGGFDPTTLLLRSLGTDLRSVKEPQQLSGFLLRNREQIREYRRKWISSVLGNNVGEAEQVKAEFEGRFGMPLTVTKAQMKNAIKLRERSVVSRIADTMEVAAKERYNQFIPDNYFDKAPEPEVDAQTARYIWSTLQSSKAPKIGESGIQ